MDACPTLLLDLGLREHHRGRDGKILRVRIAGSLIRDRVSLKLLHKQVLNDDNVNRNASAERENSHGNPLQDKELQTAQTTAREGALVSLRDDLPNVLSNIHVLVIQYP